MAALSSSFLYPRDALPPFLIPDSSTEIDTLRQYCDEFSHDQQRYYYQITGFRYLQYFAHYALPQLARISASRISQVLPRVVMDEIVDYLIESDGWRVRQHYHWVPNVFGGVVPFDSRHPHSQSIALQHRIWFRRREAFFLRQYLLLLEDHLVTVLHPLWVEARTLAIAAFADKAELQARINMTPRTFYYWTQ